ncbi:hypothetical protein FGB62_11g04 [Gracilaria domingensis]|nr:hypothetical protein FGB62_11g04 [Gracilaria domingensis]
MEGAPPLALRLVQLGRALANQSRFKKAALVYLSAATASKMRPEIQVFCMYQTALQYYNYVLNSEDSKAVEELTRALQIVHKCNLLMLKQPSSFDVRMQITALTERIYTSCGNLVSAAKAINFGLETIARSQENRLNLMKWWAYFRSRAIQNTLACDNSIQHASSMALETAEQCHKSGDKISAVGFYLSQCQLALTNPSPRVLISPQFERARSCLMDITPVSPAQRSDMTLLSICQCILEAFSCFRIGHVTEVSSNVMSRLQEAYTRARALKAAGNVKTNWKWLNLDIIAALAFYILGVVRRNDNGGDVRPKNHPTRMVLIALTKIGISPKVLQELKASDLSIAGISNVAKVALCIALFEGAARSYLAEGDLREAGVFVSAAARFVFSDTLSCKLISRVERGESIDLSPVLSTDLPYGELLQRNAVFLLMSEYHSLRASLSGARVATRFLHAMKMLPRRLRSEKGTLCITDSWQLAVSHLSLLVGTERTKSPFEIEGSHSGAPGTYEEDVARKDFVSSQVVAMALFTVGVYHLRKPAIIEAQRALSAAIDLLKDMKALNKQAVSNALAVYSGVGMLHLSITKKDCNMTQEAVSLAQAINDPVTMVRTCRQRRKLVHRLGFGTAEKQKTEKLLREAMALSEAKRKQARPHILG